MEVCVPSTSMVTMCRGDEKVAEEMEEFWDA